MHSPIVQDSKDGAVLTVHLQPKSSRTGFVGRYGDALKIRVTAPPVDGAANEELIRLLAREMSIPVTAVRIKSGAEARRKQVLLRGVPARQVAAYLSRRGW